MTYPSKISKSFLARQLSRFVRYNTVCNRTNEPLAYEVGRFLKQKGFRVIYQKKQTAGETFVNVVGTKGRRGRPFLICSHLDTVPPGDFAKWTMTGKNPWRTKIKSGSIYGLGAADDKGSLVAMLAVAGSFSHSNFKRPLMVLGTFGEESGMGGAKLFTKLWKGGKPCAALVGEPTHLGITYRHKGLGVIEIELRIPKENGRRALGKRTSVEFKGKAGHSSRPHLGENALDKAMVYLERKLKGNPNLYLYSIHGGFAANLIPDHAKLVFSVCHPEPQRGEGSRLGFFGRLTGSLRMTYGGVPNLAHPLLDCYKAVRQIVKRLEKQKDKSFYPPNITSNFGIAKTEGHRMRLVFDFRLLPGQSIKQIYSELRENLARKLRSYKGLKWRMFIERENPPLGLKRNHPFIKVGKRLLKEERIPVQLSVKPSCTEAGIYASWRVPAIIFGPGRSDGNVHAPNESIQIGEIEKAVNVYQRAIEQFCVQGKCF